MSIPTYDEFYRDILDAIQDGEIHSISEIRKIIAENRQFTQVDLEELLPSGKQTVFSNRVSWATFYLRKAGLVIRPSRGKFKLSQSGKEVQQNQPITLNNDYLMNYDSFADFMNHNSADTGVNEAAEPAISIVTPQTPQDIIAKAYQQISSSLADDLMQEILNQSPTFFEHLVVKLLVAMGYGGPFEDAGIVTQPTNDGGIDGIIKEDKLGFSQIYLQAKRWNNTVTRPELQKFAGALLDKGVSKGLFITTSKFAQRAKEYAERQHIVLIDGELLTKLMIEYNLGVSTYKTYELKSLDTDFFNNQD